MRPASRPASPSAEGWGAFFSVLFLAAVPLFLCWPVFASGKMIYGYDVSAMGVAFQTELRRSIAVHQWPLWMPDVLGGMPGIAACNLMFLYPSDLLSVLADWPTRIQIGLDAVIHIALAGIGMFFLLRRLGRGVSASLLGAFFFAVSGSELSQMLGGYYNFVEGIALVPWAFWAAHKACKDRSWFAWGLCGLAFALQILAIASQIFAYTFFAVAAFALAMEWRRSAEDGAEGFPGRMKAGVRVFQGLALALGLAFLLSAPQLWLSLQYLPLSARQAGWSRAQFLSGSVSPAEALSWLVPGFFGWQSPTYHGATGMSETSEYFGLLPWALAAGALFSLWRREAWVRWMAALALSAFFFAQNAWAPFYGPFHALPIVSGFRIWSRILFLVTFAVCVTAAFGWDALRASGSRTAALRGTALFAALALAAAAVSLECARARAVADVPALFAAMGFHTDPRPMADLLTALARNSALTTLTLVPVLMAVLIAAGRWGTKGLGASAALLLALGFHGFDQSQLIRRSITFIDPADAVGHPHFTVPPPPPEGVEPWRIYDVDNSFPDNNILLGYENLGGRESLPLQSRIRIVDAMGAAGRDWSSFLNERYYFSHTRRGSTEPGDSVTIYENRKVFPRAWLAGLARKVGGDEDAYRLLADPGFNPRLEVALPVDSGLKPGPGTPADSPKGGVVWLGRGPQSCSLGVATDRDAALVLSNAWYPSWRCAVDGRDAPVLKADGGLQAVLLPPGRHQVDFRFDPSLFYDALAACLAGLVALCGLYRYDRNR
ncbi:MAG TPA: hypothetical protein VK914_06765 [bacterium]|jgi:hypothetical protein|nr:hypothetical protein [bacterium]